MIKVKQDVLVATILLLFCGVMIWASYDIRDLGYPGLKPETWPRFLLILLSGLSALYFIKSFKSPEINTKINTDVSANKLNLRGWKKYQNAIWCFLLFSLFLGSLDYIGMLLGGILFVFALLTALGERTWRNFALHALVAVISVGLMWLIFSYALRVSLPEGNLLSVW